MTYQNEGPAPAALISTGGEAPTQETRENNTTATPVLQMALTCARRDLDIMHLAGRIRELRHQGHVIETVTVERPTDCGRFHLVGEYFLQPGETS